MSTKKHQPSVHTSKQDFSQLWKHAQKQGWYLASISDDKDRCTAFPPKNHPAALNNWAAIYTNINYKNKVVAVPHWFYSEMEKNQNQNCDDYLCRTKKKLECKLMKN